MFSNFQPIIHNVESMETSVETNFQPIILNDESMETVFHNLHSFNSVHEPIETESVLHNLNRLDLVDCSGGEQENSFTTNESEEALFYKAQLVHPSISCNKLEALQMVLMFFMRHSLTFVALEDLLKLINKILKVNSLTTTKYKFFKLFTNQYKPKHIFFCKVCSNELELLDDFHDNNGTEITCGVCNAINNCSSKKSDNYFVTFPITEQLKEIVVNKLDHLVNLPPPNTSSDTITV